MKVVLHLTDRCLRFMHLRGDWCDCHVIKHININVCLFEINSKLSRNCQEKHGNFLSYIENLSLIFTETLDKLFNFWCKVFFFRLKRFWSYICSLKCCVIFSYRTAMQIISWPRCVRPNTSNALFRRNGHFIEYNSSIT